jgi:diguanylate cyclase (GGDEF)-like protein
MRRSQRLRRGAVTGLALTVLALTVLSLVGATSTRRSAQDVTRSAALAEAYSRAHFEVAAEESLERKYRLEPSPEIRVRHEDAAKELQRALSDVHSRGGPADRRTVDTLRAMVARYQTAVAHMFAAIDARDEATILRIDNEETDPAFQQMSDLVQSATDQHTRAAAKAVADLRRVEGIVFVTTAVGFAAGLCLLAVFAMIAVGYQRALLNQAETSRHQALHDPLTGLANRTLFTNRLDQALQSAHRTGTKTSVMLLDLDRFKEVNDTLGHQYGDELLRQVATRISDAQRASDTVARLSGDEFAILMPHAGEAAATALAARILAALHRSFTLNDVTVDIEASIGAAIAPTHADDTIALMRCADIAMYDAKDSKNGVGLYRPDMHTQDSTRLVLLGDLRRALDTNDQLVVHYQPKISLQFGELCGVEALVRWQHPERGMVQPLEFIPIAETTGLINRLTTYVLRLAIGQARTWLDTGLPIPVAVNLSPRCLLDAGLVQHVTDLLREYQLPASLLRLEVTETAIMANPTLALSTLTELHHLGIRLSIDDYGTGYSSMAYLKRLPVDELKVDRTFVLNMDTDHSDASLVRSAIDLGHNLGLTVVAEGVEGSDHVTALQSLGCDIAQGYHYARPMPPENLTAWIRQHHSTTPAPDTPWASGGAVVTP